MQGSFEKKVQEKLDELKLTPSAPLWEKIELQIQPEKRRRRGLFWLPILLLLLVGAGWWLLQNGEAEKATSAGEPVNTAASPAPAKQTTSEKTTTLTPAEKTDSVTKQTGVIADQQPALTPVTATTVNTDKSTDRQTPPSKKTNLPLTAKAKKNNSIAKSEVHLSLAKQAAEPRVEQGKDVDALSAKTKKEESRIERLLFNKIPNAAIKEQASIVDNEATPPVKATTTKDSVAEQAKPELGVKDMVSTRRKLAAVSKWRWTVTARLGWSGPSSDQSSMYRDAFATPIQNSGGLYAGPTGPNTVSGGRAYSVGVGLTRSISSRLHVTAGLHYARYQSRTKIGVFRPLDTSLFFRSQPVTVGGYYYNGQQQDYTIRHQVLELPISISYQPVRSWPLLITTGASYGRLLKSNALTFNPTGNFYFENKENLSRNQVGLFSALQYRVLHQKLFALSIGPAVQYQLTSFQKEPATNKPTLLFAGVKTNINF